MLLINASILLFSEPPGAEIGLQALTELGSQWGPKLQFDHVVKSHKELKRKGMNIYRLRVFYEAFKGQQRIYMNFFSYEVNGIAFDFLLLVVQCRRRASSNKAIIEFAHASEAQLHVLNFAAFPLHCWKSSQGHEP